MEMKTNLDRRSFLAAAASATATATTAGAARAASAPAIKGGSPVRSRPLPATGYFGTQTYGDQERRQLAEVVEARQPFRWYGPSKEPPRKVAAFEQHLAARMQVRHALAVTSGSA